MDILSFPWRILHTNKSSVPVIVWFSPRHMRSDQWTKLTTITLSIQLCAWPASTPLWQEFISLRYVSSPPTAHSNCSERLWPYARAILVALENYSDWLEELQFRICLTYASSFSLFCLHLGQNANTIKKWLVRYLITTIYSVLRFTPLN